MHLTHALKEWWVWHLYGLWRDRAGNQTHNLPVLGRTVDHWAAELIRFHTCLQYAMCHANPMLQHLKAFVASGSGLQLVVFTLSMDMLHIVQLFCLLMLSERGPSAGRVNDETQSAANLWYELVAAAENGGAVKMSGVDFEKVRAFSKSWFGDLT